MPKKIKMTETMNKEMVELLKNYNHRINVDKKTQSTSKQPTMLRMKSITQKIELGSKSDYNKIKKDIKTFINNGNNREINTLVKEYNKKISKVKRTNPKIAEYQPQKLKSKDIKAKVNKGTTKDFNELKKDLKSYLKVGGESPMDSGGGAKITKSQYHSAKIKINRINKAKKAIYDKAIIDAEYKGVVRDTKENALRVKKFNFKGNSQRGWDMLVETIEMQARENFSSDKQIGYKVNYLHSIQKNLGHEGHELYAFIKNQNPKFLTDHYYDDPILQIQFTSDRLPAKEIAELSLDKWKKVIGAMKEEEEQKIIDKEMQAQFGE